MPIDPVNQEPLVRTKVFCIGFHKTGTSSLGAALKILGYRVAGPNGVYDPDIATNVYGMVDSIVERFDAFQDNPWPVLYRYLDEKHPGSKFILTIRDSQAWIASQIRDFGSSETPMRRWIYGTGSPVGHEDTYVERYESHNAEVLEYFRARPQDLLVMNLTRGDGWPALCSFLGHELPEVPFPHTNKSNEKALTWSKRLRQKVNRWRKSRISVHA